MSEAAYNAERVIMLGELLKDASTDAEVIPDGLEDFIDHKRWTEFVNPSTGELVIYGEHQFAKFIVAPPPLGWGRTLTEISDLCRKNTILQDKVADAAKGKPGGNPGNRNAAKNKTNVL